MGKNLKFPRRQKFVAAEKKEEAEEKQEISEEEHKKRLEFLKSMGINPAKVKG